MLTDENLIRVKEIIRRLKESKSVTLQERIYLTNLSKISTLVAEWLYSALANEAHIIDEELL